jgi:hypothetical protein
MAQANIGNIDPNETSGVDLAQLLTQVGAALETNNLGAGRPSYAKRGTIWIHDPGNGTLGVALFTGVADVLIGVINIAANTFTPQGVGVTLDSLGGVPYWRNIGTGASITGGGNLEANRWITLVGDHDAPGGNKYYGTNPAGQKGFFDLPSQRGLSRVERITWNWPTGGFFTWSVPANVNRINFTVVAGGGVTQIGSNPDGDGQSTPYNYPGGRGGQLSGVMIVSPGQVLTMRVGGVAEASEIQGFVFCDAGGIGAIGGGATGGMSLAPENVGGVMGGPLLLNSNLAFAGWPDTHGAIQFDFVAS